jgi:penicillin-binding protein 2
MNGHNEQNEKNQKVRAWVLIGVVTVGGLFLAGSLAKLALYEGSQFRKEAQGQSLRVLRRVPPRGLIQDRHGRLLVTNEAVNTAYLFYPHYKNKQLLAQLATILGVPAQKLEERAKQKLDLMLYYEPIKLKEGITPAQYAILMERANELPGIEIHTDPMRVYPFKDSAAHLLGYVGEISEAELDQYKELGYVTSEQIGQIGLEAYYEKELHGEPGKREVVINNYFQPLGVTSVVEPKPGKNLTLTIDMDLQQQAEKALEWVMYRIRNVRGSDGPWPNAKSGAIVVMDVKTGAILAMASRPSFDPNLFVRGISEADYAKLQDPILTPLINRSVQKAYQPGSTWKMVTSAAALTNGAFGPYETYFCPGVYDKAGKPRCWLPGGHGAVDTANALRTSCDVYYYEAGYRLGPDKMVAMAQQFGFGAKTGVDLGGEVPGLLPTAQNRVEIWEKELKDPWTIGHTVSSAIGQIVQATPLQLARYAAAIGNGGTVMKPYLLERVTDADGKVVFEAQPQEVGKLPISNETLTLIRRGMALVNGPTGTSDYGRWPLPIVGAIGKTGTAENPPQDDYGLYVSLSPANDPKLAIAVVIEQAGHGSSVCPAARAVESYFHNVKLTNGDPANIPPNWNPPAVTGGQQASPGGQGREEVPVPR